MAQINVVTTKEEQETVLQALKTIDGAVAPVSKIASVAGMRDSRVRYALIDLVDANRIEKVAHRAFNKHYVRYSYNVLEK